MGNINRGSKKYITLVETPAEENVVEENDRDPNVAPDKNAPAVIFRGSWDAKFKLMETLQAVHLATTFPMDAFNTGIYNGMELVLKTFKEEFPNYIEQPKDNK